jgi:hypothetical protein
MRTHLHRWLPTTIAVVALFVALDGPAAAAKKLNGKSILKGTVASKQLKNLSVQGIDVRDGTLTGAKVADGSLAGADVQDGSVTAQDVADGSVTGVDVKDSSLGAADLADGSVGKTELQKAAVSGLALDGAGIALIDFGTIAANTCANSLISVTAAQVADGTLSDDVVIATPDAFFSSNFSYSVKTEGVLSPYIKMCNVGATAADPDAGGGTKAWRWVAIDVG